MSRYGLHGVEFPRSLRMELRLLVRFDPRYRNIFIKLRMNYRYTFGMHHVDFTNAQRPRTPKMSSYVYKHIIETKQVDEAYAPDGYERCAASAVYTLNALIVGVLALLFVYSRQF